MRRFIGMMLVALLGGCRYRPAPVPLRGNPAELRLMAGHWDGEYRSIESGRAGSITFEISAAADSAFGDVLLTAPGALGPVIPIDLPEIHRLHAPSERLLSIRFVRVATGDVQGMLEPYRAPDCSCVVRTRFTGRVSADTIRGTFLTTLETGQQQQGSWRVWRSPR